MRKGVRFLLVSLFVLLTRSAILEASGLKGSSSDGKEKKKGEKSQLREWRIRYYQWKIKNQNRLRTLQAESKTKTDRQILNGFSRNDAQLVADIVVYRKDNEESFSIVRLGKEICGVKLTPGKADDNPFTVVVFFYGENGKGPKHIRQKIIESEELDQIGADKPRCLGYFRDIATGEKGQYKSYEVRAAFVSVKSCDEKTIEKVLSSHLRLKP